jgi:hypothetical protein
MEPTEPTFHKQHAGGSSLCPHTHGEHRRKPRRETAICASVQLCVSTPGRLEDAVRHRTVPSAGHCTSLLWAHYYPVIVEIVEALVVDRVARALSFAHFQRSNTSSASSVVIANITVMFTLCNNSKVPNIGLKEHHTSPYQAAFSDFETLDISLMHNTSIGDDSESPCVISPGKSSFAFVSSTNAICPSPHLTSTVRKLRVALESGKVSHRTTGTPRKCYCYANCEDLASITSTALQLCVITIPYCRFSTLSRCSTESIDLAAGPFKSYPALQF